MKKKTQKLRLNRETLLSLNEPTLRQAAGGNTAGTVCCSDPTVCATNCSACDVTVTCRCTNACV